MPVSPARAAAFEILLRVEREQSYASELLHSAHFATLSSTDHGLVTELVMGVLRWQSLLDRRIANVASQKLDRLDLEVLTALRLGAYQLGFLSRVPSRAAIFESVEMVKAARKRSASSLVNAVLRKLTAEAGAAPAIRVGDVFSAIGQARDARTLAENSSHPEWLVTRWGAYYGLEAARQISAYNQHPPATKMRAYDNRAVEAVASEGVKLGPGHLLASARAVLSGDVTKTASYRQGLVAIQDESSQLVALLAGHGQRILDCCAAPGGKTAVLAHHNPAATVVATELHPHRARLLRGLARLPNIRVVCADARQLPFAGGFERVLVDVPCSGTGTLARNPEIKWRLRLDDLTDLHARQVAILKSALSQIQPRGRLVYSTCSLEPEENENVVATVLNGMSEFSVVGCREELDKLSKSGELREANCNSLVAGPYLRTIPGIHFCDGFFAAILERTGK